MSEAVHALLPAIALLGAGLISMVVMPRIGLSPLVGYLLAGMALGPHGWWVMGDDESTHLLAELGVVLLLFDIGLHFSLRHIWDSRRDILGFGPLQMISCTALISLVLAYTFELPLEILLLLGAALALSSTAVVSQALQDYGQGRAPIGQSSIAMLIFQDICAIFLMIAGASIMAGGESLAWNLLLTLFKSIVAFGATLLIGRYVITPLFTLIAGSRREETFTVMALLMVLAAAAATGALGLSLTLGAFLAGMMIATTPFRAVVQAEIKPFRGLLVAFFFIAVGMSLDWRSALNEWQMIVLMFGALVAIKVLCAYIAARPVGHKHGSALQMAFYLAQGSEFAFVIIALPGVGEILGETLSDSLVAAIALSMVATPWLAKLGHWLVQWRADKAWKVREGECQGTHTGDAVVIVLGMSTAGRMLVDALKDNAIAYKAFDYDYQRFVKARIDGYEVAFGDLADLRLMETVEAAHAKVLAISCPRPEVASEVGAQFDAMYPNLRRVVLVQDTQEAAAYSGTANAMVVDRSSPPGLDFAGAVMTICGVEDGTVEQWIRHRQQSSLEQVLAPVTN